MVGVSDVHPSVRDRRLRWGAYRRLSICVGRGTIVKWVQWFRGPELSRVKVGVLGSGDVGKALAAGFASRGHDVVIGSRTPAKLADWVSSQDAAVVAGTFDDAAAHGRMLVVAVRGDAAETLVGSLGAEAVAGKVVIDATNPLSFDAHGPPGLFVGTEDSLGERLQRAMPGASVVQCFNTVNHAKMVDPAFAGGVPEMMLCGDDAEAKAAVADVAMSFGWPGVLDVGGIDGAPWLEALVPLWVRVGGVLGTWGHAFKVARDP